MAGKQQACREVLPIYFAHLTSIFVYVKLVNNPVNNFLAPSNDE